jgi:hypothetical protein
MNTMTVSGRGPLINKGEQTTRAAPELVVVNDHKFSK